MLRPAASSMEENLYLIGGASVYKATLKYADRLYISKVKKLYEGDVFFPEYDRSRMGPDFFRRFSGFYTGNLRQKIQIKNTAALFAGRV